jgi:flagellar hook-basal body complex protein FliE
MAVDIIRDFTGLGETHSQTVRIAPEASPDQIGGGQSFSDLVKEFAGDVNSLQFRAGHAIDQLVTGEAADVHQVMVAVEEAGIALDLMLEVRNRLLEGYQELIRMQV